MADTEAKKSNKSRLVGRYGSRQPDRDWDDETGFEDLAGFAADELEKFEADNNKLKELYAKDPRFAGLMNHAVNGGEILDYLLDAYGSDFADALNGDEGRKKLSDRKKKEAEDAKSFFAPEPVKKDEADLAMIDVVMEQIIALEDEVENLNKQAEPLHKQLNKWRKIKEAIENDTL